MAEDTPLQKAIEALRRGERSRAKEILTGLIKVDQNDPQVWIWMSAAVETARERIYCLQTALRLDPANVTARRGLVLLGALPPEETTTPFPLNHARAWEQELMLAHEQPRQKKSLKTILKSPAVRLIGLLLLGTVACGMITLVLLSSRSPTAGRARTHTPGPSPTFSPTPTMIWLGTPRTPTATFTGPTPLSALLSATYTPTPLYVNTPRSVLSSDIYRAAKQSYQNNNWPEMIGYMKQVATAEPGSADPQYYIGEGYRFMGDYGEALKAYELAIDINPAFGPAYLGRARVTLALNPNADVMNDLNRAVQYAPDFAEAYLARAQFLTDRDQPAAALADLETARTLNPGSPQLQVELARTYLAMGRYAEALQAAEAANQADITLLDAYLVLGQAYQANGRSEEAVGAMQTYNLYRPGDPSALIVLAGAYNADGRYGDALQAANTVLEDDVSYGEVWLQRGVAYLGLGDGPRAEYDFKTYLRFDPRSFTACLGWGRALYIQDRYADGYFQMRTCNQYALSDRDLAQYYYWNAIAQERINRLPEAANDWRALLALPPEAVTPEMRAEAEAHLAALGG